MSTRPSPYPVARRSTTDDTVDTTTNRGKLRKSKRGSNLDNSTKTFQCPKCPKLCRTKGHVDQHVKTQHGDKNEWEHVCESCNKRFLYKHHLTLHLKWSKIHNPELQHPVKAKSRSKRKERKSSSNLPVDALMTTETSCDAWSTVTDLSYTTDADSRQSEGIEETIIVDNFLNGDFGFMLDNAVDFDYVAAHRTKIGNTEDHGNSFPIRDISYQCHPAETTSNSNIPNFITDFVLGDEWTKCWNEMHTTAQPLTVASLPHDEQSCDSIDSFLSFDQL